MINEVPNAFSYDVTTIKRILSDRYRAVRRNAGDFRQGGMQVCFIKQRLNRRHWSQTVLADDVRSIVDYIAASASNALPRPF
jgi:hypothetical protein